MNSLNDRDESTRNAWRKALQNHQMLYPDERVVSFFSRRFPNKTDNCAHHAVDIGCGSGRHLKLMLDYGFQTWGIDYSSESVELVNSCFKDNPNFCGSILCDYREHTFPHLFHAVVAWGVLFLNPPSEMVKNLRSMKHYLDPKGRLIVNFRTRENFHYGLGREIEPGCFILDQRAGEYQGMCYTFTDLRDVEQLVNAAGGLEIVHVEKTTFSKNGLKDLHSWLQVEIRLAST